ncbi:alpha/beta hydrolase [Pseudonocardia benzenivorans]|jgi:acetyl esterase|uniref:Alpha/beta hydrolase n=1 Tax=Pseudonocardia benzenivorans TaxID=228005 RepID=A0ABW3VQU6_9PSEU
MALDPQFRTVLDTLEANGALPLVRGSAIETREHYRALSLSRRGADYVPFPVADVADDEIDGPGGPLPIRVYRPLEDRGGVVTYLHGGGWVVGDLDTHDPVCRKVAGETGAVVVSVDYRLAPEHPHPAGIEDTMAGLRWTHETYPDRPLGVAGDSAGASLAAGAALRARDESLPLAAQLLWYPSTDPTQSSKSVRDNGEGYFLTADAMRWFYDHYVPGGTDDPVVDLQHADVAGVAPAVVATAEFDPLRDEGDAYVEQLRAAGVPVTHVPGPGLIHGYAAFIGLVESADAAGARALAALADLLAAAKG